MESFAASTGARLLAGAFFFGLLGWLFYRLGRGQGRKLFVLLSLVLAILFFFSPIAQAASLLLLVIAIIWLELLWTRKSATYSGAQAIIEGGGIKRGLSPPEAAVVLGKPLKLTLTLVFFEMLRKGFVEQREIFPLMVEVDESFHTHGLGMPVKERGDKRRLAAQAIPATLHKYEEAFLEIFEANPGVPASEIDYGIAVQPLVRYVAGRVGGFDLEETRDYYRLIIDRAPKEARTDGVLTFERQKVFDRNFGFLLLAEDFRAVLDQEDYSYLPVWQRETEMLKGERSFATWAEKVIASMDGVVNEEEVKLDLSREMDLLSATLMNDIARATFYG